MKYFVIAGEHSGDQHSAALMKELSLKDPQAEFRFLGGDLMSEIAGEPVVHISDMAFMGFTRVIANLGKISKNFKKAKKAIMEFNPDVVLFVDYPGFNLRMAKWAKKRGFRTFYYIVPAVWAWNTKRVYKIKKYCDRIFPILPFEPEFYKKYGIDSEYLGNPVSKSISDTRKKLGTKKVSARQIALLPGSRKQEIEKILPVMLKVAENFDEYVFVIAAMEAHRDLYTEILGDNSSVELIYDKPLEVLHRSDAAVVTSGTATLETALMGLPQVVCYRTNKLSYHIAKRLIKVPYISLANLILGGPAIPELIQKYCTEDYIGSCLMSILPGGPNHEDQLEISMMVREKLGDEDPSERVSEVIISALKPD